MHLVITAIAMLAFAANSILARMALGQDLIDPASYTLIRLASGALALSLMVWRPNGPLLPKAGSWISGLALITYAAAFSFAYLALDTGTGALILFATVQASMIGWALYKGDRPVPLEWAGLTIAFAALVWLVSPGVSAPDPLGAALMGVAGVAWGIYSLRGRGASNPLGATAGNFLRSVPAALLVFAVFFSGLHASPWGMVLAALSGVVTSAMGYAIWYQALRGLSSTQAAIVQLSVPALAAIGGVGLSGESLSLRFVASCALIIGGVAVAILAKQKRVSA
ncbi:MAG: DMT family transporter [Hyphomicrobiaceae bacterium]|nr:DMT family transporter [Hyphomicrobiaceae bacterium]